MGIAVLAWILSSVFNVGVVPVDGWAVGLGGGSVWIEHPTPGDDSAWRWHGRVEPGPPALWFDHERGGGWEDWSAPLWPVVLVVAGVAWCRRVGRGLPMRAARDRIAA